jgi:hypothetical protein
MYQSNESFESSNSSIYNVDCNYQNQHRLSPLSSSVSSSSDSSFGFTESTNNYYSNWYNTYYNNYANYNYCSPNGYYNYSNYTPYQYCYSSQSPQEFNDVLAKSTNCLESSPVSTVYPYSKTNQSVVINANVVTSRDESKNVESQPKTSNKSSTISRKHQLPDRAVEILNEWFDEHIQNPYPSLDDKERLAKAGGINVKQVNAWFSNRRNRSQNTKPKRMKRVIENEFNNIVNVLSVNTAYNYDEYKKQIIENFKKNLSRENF